MASFSFLSFLTDYGLSDGFVASCHGVAAKIAPRARVIDITHLVPPGDVRRGAAVLAQAVPYLPPAVHVTVVDPGVGTSRRAIAVAAGEVIFVGPDNGVLTWAIEAAGGASLAVSLTNRELWLDQVTPTFHGRDIFMPAAAHLAAGAPLASAGEQVDLASLVALPVPASVVRDGVAEGEVVTADRFGNIQLSVAAADANAAGLRPGGTVLVGWADQRRTMPFGETFGSVPEGDLVAYVDGMGMVSLAVNRGDAAARLNIPAGTQVTLTAQ